MLMSQVMDSYYIIKSQRGTKNGEWTAKTVKGHALQTLNVKPKCAIQAVLFN